MTKAVTILRLPGLRLTRRVAADRSGVVAVLFALATPMMIGFIGLGVEVGLWYLTRHRLQATADSAAISGAFEALHGSERVTAAAGHEAARLGLDTFRGDTIAVHSPPTRGPNAGREGAVEVALSKPLTLLFSSLFVDTVTVTARSVAMPKPTGSACVLSLDKVALRATDITGSADITTPGCVVAANSTSHEAITVTGSGSLSAESLSTPGGYAVSGSGSLTTDSPPQTGTWPLPDPYAALSAPSPSSCAATGFRQIASTPVTLAPGTYCDGMEFGAQSVVDLAPGTYVVNRGSFRVNGGASVRCSACTGPAGVTIVLTGSGGSFATVEINGGANIDLKAPSTGTYAGMLFFQDRFAPSTGTNAFTGNAGMKLTGALYFPSQQVDFAGNIAVGGAQCTQVIGRTIQFTGSSAIGAACEGTGITNIATGGTVALAE